MRNPRLLNVWKDGKEGPQLEKDSPYWIGIQIFDAKGKPSDGLPEQGGYFEMVVPKALLTEEAKQLTLGWIDFYR